MTARNRTTPDDVRTIARVWEYDRYLTALLAPSHLRRELVALAAFSGELRRIGDMVSEPMLGEIRLQWWRDLFTSQAGRSQGDLPPRNSDDVAGPPLAAELFDAAHLHKLPTGLLIALSDAASLEISGGDIPDIGSLSSHFARREGSLFELSARVLGAGQGEPVIRAASVAGQAYGMAWMLCRLPADLARGRCLLPAEVMHRHGIDPAELMAGRSAGLEPVIEELGGHAERLAQDARRQLSQAQLRSSAALVLAPLALVGTLTRHARRHSARLELLHPVSPFTRAWRLWGAARLGIARMPA